jgi:hypothetical protein
VSGNESGKAVSTALPRQSRKQLKPLRFLIRHATRLRPGANEIPIAEGKKVRGARIKF